MIEHTTNCAHIRRHSADFVRSSRLTTRRAAGSSEVYRLTTLDASTRTVRSNVALTTIYNSLCMTLALIYKYWTVPWICRLIN